MKVITFDDIVNLNISPSVCYEWVSEMIAQKKSALLPPKISIHPSEETFCNIMPCMLKNGMGGTKIVNRYPHRIPSLDSNLSLINMESGEFLAMMDSNWITAMRTGAVAVHSIVRFAKTDYKTIAIMGLGNTARATLLTLASVYPDKQFYIKLLRYNNQEILFEKRFELFDNLVFSYVDTYEELIHGSDVLVSCVTYLEHDICANKEYEKGILVVPVHTRGFMNCDLFFDKIYADDYGHVKHFKNFEKYQYFAEVSDVVLGNAVGRENDNERILVYNIGLAIHDIFFASKIYEMLEDDEKLQEVDLLGPKEMYWV